MSTLKVTTVQTSAGGAVTLTKQHAAKAWWNLNGTGTIALRDSFNTNASNQETFSTGHSIQPV